MDLDSARYWRLLINQSLLRFFLLKSLEHQGVHGYALVHNLTVISGGLCKPSQGTIYPVLHELEKNKCLKGHWVKIKNRERKVYVLTERGRNALAIASDILHKALAAIGS